MTSLYLLIPVSLIFCALAIWFFFWAVNSGQYDDLDGEGERILFDDETDDPVGTDVGGCHGHPDDSPPSKSRE
jgi:cbb3-type cytochrome oxidase maturation protein